MQPLGIPEHSWEIVGIDYVTDLPKSGTDGYTSIFIMACHLTKMAIFVPCHKEITSKESADLFINRKNRKRKKSLTERACKGHRVLGGYAAL